MRRTLDDRLASLMRKLDRLEARLRAMEWAVERARLQVPRMKKARRRSA